MVECLSPDLLRLPEAFNDVRDKRKAMSLADVNEKNMIHLVSDDPVLRTLLLTADSTISSILSHLSLLRINSGISEFFQFSWLLSLLEVTSVRSSLLSKRGLPRMLLKTKSAISSLETVLKAGFLGRWLSQAFSHCGYEIA